MIFVCENNLYGASTRVDRVMRNDRISDRAAAYGIRGETVDGNDVLAVYEAARSAAAECRGRSWPGPARAAHLSSHRPLAPRRLQLPAQGRARGVAAPRPDRSARASPARSRAGRSGGARRGPVRDPGPVRGRRRVRQAPAYAHARRPDDRCTRLTRDILADKIGRDDFPRLCRRPSDAIEEHPIHETTQYCGSAS